MASERYQTIRGPVTASIEERRSVFECWLRRADSEQDARTVVEEARTTHWDARHHCSAWVLGPNADLARSNDDGEPSGTAGAPMLEVLTHSGLSDVVAVVTRWFGGTLLGAGGLVRAYGDAVRAALAQAVPLRRDLLQLASLEVEHADAGRIEHDLRAHGVVVQDVDYAGSVTIHLAVPVKDQGVVAAQVARLTGGSAALRLGTTQWVDHLGG